MQVKTDERGQRYYITDAAAALSEQALRDEWDSYEGDDFDACTLCARHVEHTVAEHEFSVEENNRHAEREQAALEKWARAVYDYDRDFDFNGGVVA